MSSADFLAWRTARRLTQREAAALLGIGQKRVWAMEAGKAPVSKQTEKQLEMLDAAWELLAELVPAAPHLGLVTPAFLRVRDIVLSPELRRLARLRQDEPFARTEVGLG